jgi:hypothetical protein
VNSGDGQNEFTFSGDTPGVLTITLKATVAGYEAMSASDQAQYRFSVGAIGNSTFA